MRSDVGEETNLARSIERSSAEPPIAVAWAVAPSAGEKKCRKRRSKKQRLGIRSNPPMVEARPHPIGYQSRRQFAPEFRVGQKVTYFNAHVKGCEGSGMITAVIQPGIDGYSPDDNEYRYEIDTIYVTNQDPSGWIREEQCT